MVPLRRNAYKRGILPDPVPPAASCSQFRRRRLSCRQGESFWKEARTPDAKAICPENYSLPAALTVIYGGPITWAGKLLDSGQCFAQKKPHFPGAPIYLFISEEIVSQEVCFSCGLWFISKRSCWIFGFCFWVPFNFKFQMVEEWNSEYSFCSYTALLSMIGQSVV